LLRVSCLGKLLSDHPLPLNLPALCQTSDGDEAITLPAVNNYGDVIFALDKFKLKRHFVIFSGRTFIDARWQWQFSATFAKCRWWF
jgi:hypothetical protein